MKKKSHSHPPAKTVKQFAPPLPEADDSLVCCLNTPSRLIDRAEVMRRVPVSYPTLWSMMRNGNFPKSKNIGGKAAWLESEVEEWINRRPDVPLKA